MTDLCFDTAQTLTILTPPYSRKIKLRFKGGRPVKKFHKSPALADLPQAWHFADLRFAGPIFFGGIRAVVICGFVICGPKLFCGLKTSATPQIHTFSS